MTNEAKPAVALVSIENTDRETISLSTNRQFIELIERSWERHEAEGGICSAEMRKRLKAKITRRKDGKSAKYADREGKMLQSVRGVYRNGKIELSEKVPDIETAEVIVTFLPNGQSIKLGERGFSPEQIIELRERLATFEEDWNAPGMEAYDNLPTR